MKIKNHFPSERYYPMGHHMMVRMGDDDMFYKNAIQKKIEQCMELLLKDSIDTNIVPEFDLQKDFQKKKQQFVANDMRVLKCQCKFKLESIRTVYEKTFVDIILLYTILVENGKKMFHTEGYVPCKCEFERGVIRQLYMCAYPWNQVPVADGQYTKLSNHTFKPSKETGHKREPNPERGGYDALQAVKYAERYWNDYNPNYPKFDNDCTNYISQCLFAGGAKMVGYERAKGWWMRGGTWSYSWTTAHALYMYLTTSRTGLRAKEVGSQKQLLLGDVICYDFEGDGRINHTTIVVAKTVDGEPLVNAHTYNSRNRLWSYEDSTAYTNQIRYKFLQIYL